MGISRREFLQLAGLVAAGLGGGRLPAWAQPEAAYPIVINGENFGFGHLIRDGKTFALPKPSLRKDVVIVGGGVSGLRAAYALKDTDLLVLEKEERVGGHARMGEWHGIGYSEGVAYLPEVDPHLRQFFAEIGFAPKEIPNPVDVLLDRQRFVANPFEDGAKKLPYSAKAQAAFLRFAADLDEMETYPGLPFEKLPGKLLPLDRISFAQYLKPYGPELIRFMDLYCRSALGGTVHEVSALGGVYFQLGELGPRHALPGGIAGLPRLMAEKLDKAGAGRIRRDAKVLQVQPKGDRAWVSYLQGEELVTVEAKTVIVAAAKHIAKHIVKGLPASQFAAMASLQYEPILVANVLLNGNGYRQGFDVWTPEAGFTDVVCADWIDGAPKRKESVLTIYHPLLTAQRGLLLDDSSVKAMVRQDVRFLDQHWPGLAKQVNEVRAYRRGHAIVCSTVNSVSQLLGKIKKPVGNVFFAHSDGQISGCIEAAIYEGEKAAKLARLALSSARIG